MTHIAVFASGGGTNFQAIIDRIDSGDLPNTIVRVLVSNNSSSGAVRIARGHHVETAHISAATHPHPNEFERGVAQVLARHEIGLIVLAGYMKLLPAAIVRTYHNRIINIHPALLPEFGGKGMYGTRVHEAVIEAGAKETGVTVHYVNEEYDEGRIIAQRRVPVFPTDTAVELAARVLVEEHDLYWRVIDHIVNGRPLAKRDTPCDGSSSCAHGVDTTG